jgi:hypothetical protein
MVLACLLVMACGRGSPGGPRDAGARLEAAAQASGLVADPSGPLIGVWSRETDRVCIVPSAKGAARIGALVDYGEGQTCAGSGTLTRSGAKVTVQLGDCRIAARFDGERLTFPAEVPIACERLCRGRASFASLSVSRQSESASEAATLRRPSGTRLCA